MKSSSTASSETARSPGLYLALTLAGVIASLAVAEVVLRVFVVPITGSRAHRVHLVYTASHADVVLGDSHLFVPFVNSERFVNLAAPGSSPQALEIVAREYFRHVEPGRVILEASPQLFRGSMELRRAQRQDEYYTQNIGLPVNMYVFEPGIVRQLAGLWSWSAHVEKMEAARLRGLRAGAHVERRRLLRASLSAEDHMMQTAVRVKQNRPMPNVERSESFAAYRRMLDALLQRGARVCMARTPVTRLYLEKAGKDERYVRVETALRNLAAARDVRFVDFEDLGLRLDVVVDFTNPDHLTTRAGERYAARLEAACFPEDATP